MNTLSLEDGRVVTLEPVAPHEAMELAEGCRQLSGVRQWWRIAMAVAAVRSIDGVPLPLPTHEKHIEGMVSRFSREDLKAISGALAGVAEEEAVPDIECAELTPLETLRMWRVVGEFEGISGWVAPAFVAAAVRRIGNEAVTFPTSRAEVKALVARLGSAGMNKASEFTLSRRRAEAASEADRRIAAKN